MHKLLPLLALWAGCTQPTQTSTRPPEILPEDCPPPSEVIDGYYLPDYMHSDLQVSKGGKWVMYKLKPDAITLLDTKSLEETEIQPTLPDNGKIAFFGGGLWSPYDEDLLLFEALVRFDSSGPSSATGQKLYLLDVSTKKVEDVTPFQSRYGIHSLRIVAWLAGSGPGRDSIVGSFAKSRDSKGNEKIRGIYLPSKNTIIPRKTFETRYQSYSGKYTALASQESSDIMFPPYRWNNIQSSVLDSFSSVSGISWSLDERLVVISGSVISDSTNDDRGRSWAWILHSDAVINSNPTPVKINLYRTECMHWGVKAFLTNHSLVMALFRGKEPTTQLYEVGFDGKIIRQLTFFKP